MSFLESLEVGTNKTAYTANGAISNTSTLDPLLDFFSNAGAMRGKEAKAVELFNKAYAAEPTLAMRCLFYLRDVRGGQGERSVFRAILKTLDEETVNKVAKHISEYGRWDEVPLTPRTMDAMLSQLNDDMAAMNLGKPVSLLAKWLPSENASSSETRKKAYEIMKHWGMKPRQYRTRVSKLRKHIKLLEQSMSAREWSEIQYDKLPSQAHRKHIKAFKRHDNDRYEAFLGKVEKGESKINSNTLYTYEIYNLVHRDWSGQNTRTANAMWKALPDYTNGANALVLADVSGSMTSSYHSGVSPMSVSVSLALYFAERNKGAFNGYFMTFTERSRLQKISGNTLSEKMSSIERADWGMSTNLQSAFDAILDAAKASNAPQSELPKILYVISDMQFNVATNGNQLTNFEAAERKFIEAGYELPHVVFWNVNSSGNEAPATKYDSRVTLISGSNQSTFQYAVQGKTPMELMLEVLNSKRYSTIEL